MEYIVNLLRTKLRRENMELYFLHILSFRVSYMSQIIVILPWAPFTNMA